MLRRLLHSLVLAAGIIPSGGCHPPKIIVPEKPVRKPSPLALNQEVETEKCRTLLQLLKKNLILTQDPLFRWDLSRALFWASQNHGSLNLSPTEAQRLLDAVLSLSASPDLPRWLEKEKSPGDSLNLRCGHPIKNIIPWTLPEPGLQLRSHEPGSHSKAQNLAQQFGVPLQQRDAYLQDKTLTQYDPSMAKRLILIRLSKNETDPRLTPSDSSELAHLQDQFFSHMGRAHSPYVRRYFFDKAIRVLIERLDRILKSLEAHHSRFVFVTIPHSRHLDLLSLIGALKYNHIAYIVVESR